VDKQVLGLYEHWPVEGLHEEVEEYKGSTVWQEGGWLQIVLVPVQIPFWQTLVSHLSLGLPHSIGVTTQAPFWQDEGLQGSVVVQRTGWFFHPVEGSQTLGLQGSFTPGAGSAIGVDLQPVVGSQLIATQAVLVPQSVWVLTIALLTQVWVLHLSLTPLKVEMQVPETQETVLQTGWEFGQPAVNSHIPETTLHVEVPHCPAGATQGVVLGRVTQQEPETTVSLTQLLGSAAVQASTGTQVEHAVSQIPQQPAPQVLVFNLQSLATTSSGEVPPKSSLSILLKIK
jgi:hypothetical protein